MTNYQWKDIQRQTLKDAIKDNAAVKLVNNSANMDTIISWYGSYQHSPIGEAQYIYFVSRRKIYRVTHFEYNDCPIVCQSLCLPSELFGKIIIYPKRHKR